MLVAKLYPKCDDYLRIQWEGEGYKKIEEFISLHPNAKKDELYRCIVNYRGVEKTYKEFIDDSSTYGDELRFVEFNPPMIVMDKPIRAAKYFLEKAISCLKTARFFASKSKLILDTDYNLHWSQGYIPQYFFRCIYFGTAVTWYSNTFDQLLQAVYWAYELYTEAKDKDGNLYDNWDDKKVMTCCTYGFVLEELQNREKAEIRKLLTTGSGKIEKVRCWANYIKHKGGIDYKDSQVENPFQFYSISEQTKVKSQIDDFKSPIKIDIDEESKTLLQAHRALYECTTQIIEAIDIDKYSLNSLSDY